MICRYTKLKRLQDVPATNLTQLANWNHNHPTAIHEEEIQFINADDLMVVAKTPKTRLRRLFEQQLVLRTRGLYGTLAPKRKVEGASNWTVYGDDKRVEILGQLAILSTAVVMLVLPMWVLAAMDGLYKKLGIITAFVSIFTTVLSSGTLARPFEVLAATAG